ncbi:hypothetical protein GGTG_07340 [Gaeumannomyces tritici R3-111a-1]|uniref:Uncharacterized protein n=1 Tax=Gaeumannomyces tritici (strain R3-111a-1) TaxID=644352 RepID=J3P1E3_GAET3|nr:hypothetical protein GGTG_07340 [Gaeumannomyces tritici R3-111a-1]EJT77428.1 hypothetical protein GGTG_07340 [Gaeumannomyces tritici R3-111a-1]
MFSVVEMPSPTFNSLLPVRLRSWLTRLGTTAEDSADNNNNATTTMASSPMFYSSRAQLLLVLVAILATVSAIVVGDQAPNRSGGSYDDAHDALLESRQAAAPPAAVCVSNSAPNTISAKFPNSATGVINGSLVVVPIPMADARAAVPAQWGILEGALKANLPGFPEGMYPLFIQAVQDHDLKLHAFNINIPDFARVSLEFPFIDLLGDGYTSFRWAPEMLLSASNPMAISGSVDYGTKAHPATFDPECDGYKASPDSSCTTTFTASAPATGASFSLSVSPDAYGAPFELPVAFFVNATNQPTFANGTACSNMIRMFDQSLFSDGRGADPRPVAGTIAVAGMGPGLLSWSEADAPRQAFGIQVATPFAENNYIPCHNLQGYGA